MSEVKCLNCNFIKFPLEKYRTIGYVSEIQGIQNPWLHFVRV